MVPRRPAVGLWFVWMFVDAGMAKQVSGSVPYNCLKYPEKTLQQLVNTAMKISCGLDDVIVDVDVISGLHPKEACQDGQCEGLTSNLMVDIANCFWKTNCSLHFPTDTLTQTSNFGCYGFKPDYLLVKSWKCFKRNEETKVLFDFCSNTVPPTAATQQGIVRSHPGLPWYYTPLDQDCPFTISFNSDKSFQFLVVTVKKLDLGEEDYLGIETLPHRTLQDIDAPQTLTFNREDVNGVRLWWNTTSSQISYGGEGVLICFTFTGNSAYTSIDACDYVTSTMSAVVQHYEAPPPETKTSVTETPPKCSDSNRRQKRNKQSKKGRKNRKKDRKNKKDRKGKKRNKGKSQNK